MNGIMLLKIINRFSMLFIIFNFLLFQGESLSINALIYVGFCFTSYIAYILRKREVGILINLVLPLFVSIPSILYYTRMENIVLACVITLYSIIFNVKYNKNYYIGASKTEFLGGVSIAIALIFLSILSQTTLRFKSVALPYMIPYLGSLIALSRSTRMIKYNISSKTINKSNFFYGGVIGVIWAFLGVEVIRNSIVKVLSHGFSIFYLYFAKLLGIIAGLLAAIIPTGLLEYIRNIDALENMRMAKFEGIKQYEDIEQKESWLVKLFTNQYFILTIKVIIISIITYLIIRIVLRIFKNYTNNNYNAEDFVQEEEFMRKSSSKRLAVIEGLINKFKYMSYEEKIRYYYCKFIRKCINNNIDIKCEDTTEDINNKASQKFNINILSEMREMYIPVRYNNMKINKAVYDRYINICKGKLR